MWDRNGVEIKPGQWVHYRKHGYLSKGRVKELKPKTVAVENRNTNTGKWYHAGYIPPSEIIVILWDRWHGFYEDVMDQIAGEIT